MRHLSIVLLVLLGCDDEDGIWISESCRPYENTIREISDFFNERNPEYAFTVEKKIKKSEPVNSNRRLNDDVDYFYCYPNQDDDSDRGGSTGIGYGDINLYGNALDDPDLLGCVLIHEFGHRFMSLRHNDNPETIMYGGLFVPEMIPGCMELPWE